MTSQVPSGLNQNKIKCLNDFEVVSFYTVKVCQYAKYIMSGQDVEVNSGKKILKVTLNI